MTTYKLVPCADSFFIVDARDTGRLAEGKYPSAYIPGTVTHTKKSGDGWNVTTEPVIGAREFAEALVEALNAAHAKVDLTEDDSAHLQAAE